MPGPSQTPGSLESLVELLALQPQSRRRRQLLQAGREWWKPETVARLYDEVVRLVRVDLRQAERLARAAAWIAAQIEDEGSRAASLRALGHVFYLKRKYEPAREHYQAALAIYERLGMELDVGRTISGSLQTLIYLGRYDEAFACAERAQTIFLKHGDHLRLARLDTNMGNILHRQDRFEEALERYRRAYTTFARIGDPQDVAITLQNMATCQISLNEFREALETYHTVRTYSESHHMPLLVAHADYNIAYLYYLRGEYTRAMELYSATREHCHTLGDAYHQGLCDLDQSEMYLELNLSEEGAHLARRAFDTFQQLGMGYETAKAVTNLAIASSHHGDTGFALDLFLQARDLFTRERNEALTATIDLYQALVFYQEGRLAEARTLSESAFRFFSPSPLGGKAALCQLLLARIHLDTGHGEEAKRVCLAALQKLEQAETPALSCQAYFVLGLIEEALGAPEAAYEAYLKAHEGLENLRSHLKADEMKIAFLKDKLAVYESLVRMCLGRGPSAANLEAAFAYIEQAKSRSLADLIAFRAHRLPASRKARRALVEQVESLRGELNWYSRTIQHVEGRSANLEGPRLEKLRRAARDCEQRLVESLANLRVEDQEFANLEAAGSIDLETIRSALPEDAMLVEYYRAGDAFCVCLLSRGDLKIVELGPAPALRRVLQLLRFQLSKFRLGPEYVRTFQQQLLEAANEHLREFYRQLIAPVASHLEEAAHLIIAPHGFLHYLPFHALFDGERYLGDRFSISYTPSASVYYLCSTKSAPPAAGALVLGVPDPSAPHILDEVQAVSSVLSNAEVFTGAEATLAVLREKGSQCRFVHIATHGWFRQDSPMFSSISLGDSQLSLFDLYQLDLPAELVTLSGCGTGLNVVVGGDELLGLVRGLLYAGAQGVLVTLWDVNDQSTAEFMELFYERLKTNPNKAQAVQRATAEIRKKYAHPFYWAPFVLVGKYA
jgi:CHAT domain-containing protein/tetratricopeptide (TPR) repeat protein